MKEIKIAICDDEEFYQKELEKFISVYGNEAETALSLKTFSGAEQMLEDVQGNGFCYDMLFLDIEMPGISGVEAAKRMREMNLTTVICFVTSHSGYALNAFELDAIGYIMKPVKYTDVKRMMDKAKMQIYYQWDYEEAEKRYIQIATNHENYIVEWNKIIYIEKRRNQCVFHMTDREIVCYDTLEHVFHKLDPHIFLYTHQGYIANFNYIKEVKKTVVCFGQGMEIPLSRKWYQEIKERHIDKICRLRSEKIYTQ